eukprot:505962-Amphidinium_carterae.1
MPDHRVCRGMVPHDISNNLSYVNAGTSFMLLGLEIQRGVYRGWQMKHLRARQGGFTEAVSYTHLRAHETEADL